MTRPISIQSIFGGIFAVFAMSACMTTQLAKYQSRNDMDDSSRTAQTGNEENSLLGVPGAAGSMAPKQATIYAVDQQTFRILVKDDRVWEAALDLLLRNYNLTIIDRSSGVMTTEWDSFFLDGKVYRNKLSIRIRRINTQQCELRILNNVEALRDANGIVSDTWLPAEDRGGETARLVQNLALVLGEPPPVLPPGMIAREVDGKTSLQ